MKSFGNQQAWWLATTAILAMSATANLPGQTPPRDVEFDLPTSESKTALRPSTKQPFSPAAVKAQRTLLSQPGKTSLKPSPSGLPDKVTRAPFPGKDPKGHLDGQTTFANPLEIGTAGYQTTTRAKKVTPVGHLEPPQTLTLDGVELPAQPVPRHRGPQPPQMFVAPSERGTPPSIRGSQLQLQPGETATERSMRLMTMLLESERQNEELRAQQADLLTRNKEGQDQLLAAAREIRSARKELTTARDDLGRLRNDVQSLRERVRASDKEHAAVLQSMGPLLQQLLESEDVGSLPPNPME